MILLHRNISKKAFTLVEIIMCVTLLSVFFVMAISTAIVMIHNMTVSEHRILATYYAEDLLSWLKTERERDWKKFRAAAFDASSGAAVAGGRVYCVNDAATRFNTLSNLLVNGPCTTNDYSGIRPTSVDTNVKIFKREVNFRAHGVNNNQIDVTVAVKWLEVGREYQTGTSATFTFLEQQ